MHHTTAPHTRPIRTLATTLLALALLATLHPLAARPATAAGRTIDVPAGGSIQDALDSAGPGDTVQLAAGSYAGRIAVARSGQDGAPVSIRGAGLGKTTLAGTVRITGAFVSLSDLAIDAGGSDSDAVGIVAPAHHVTLARLHLYGGRGYGVRVGTDVSEVLVASSQIHGFDAGDRDAHGVGIMTARAVTVRDCDIFGTSGDAIQVNTPDYPGYGRWAEDIRIERNRLRSTRENALDIKSTHGLVAFGNLAWGFHPVDSSDGMAIQVQYDARDITLAGNQIWDAAEGIEVSRGSKNGTAYPLAPSGVLVAGNYIHDIAADPGGGRSAGSGIVVLSSSAVRVYNNTVLGVASAGLYVSASRDGDYPQQLDVRDNALGGARDDLWLSFDPDLMPSLRVDYNHYVLGRVSGGDLGAWRAAGYEAHATSGDPRVGGDGRPLDGSPLRDSGTSVGLAFLGSAPDRGWGEMAGLPAAPALDRRTFLPAVAR